MSTELFLGSLEIGVLVSSVIYGVTCLQCYLYFVEYSTKDSLLLKLFVAALMATETFHAALLAHALYIYSVKNFGNVDKLFEMIWSLLLQIFVATVLSTATQLFFAFRIYRLSDRFRRVIPSIICVMSLTTLGLAMCFVISGLRAPSWSYANSSRGILPYLGGAVTFLPAVCDSLIAATIICLLRIHNRRSPLARTSRMINRLIWYTLNTGLLTTVFALIAGIILMMGSNSLVYMSFHFISTRLYMCSLVSTLNSRETVQRELEGDSGITDDGIDNTTGNDAVFTTGGFELTQMACGTTIDSASQLHIYQESNDAKFSGLDHNPL